VRKWGGYGNLASRERRWAQESVRRDEQIFWNIDEDRGLNGHAAGAL